MVSKDSKFEQLICDRLPFTRGRLSFTNWNQLKIKEQNEQISLECCRFQTTPSRPVCLLKKYVTWCACALISMSFKPDYFVSLFLFLAISGNELNLTQVKICFSVCLFLKSQIVCLFVCFCTDPVLEQTSHTMIT